MVESVKAASDVYAPVSGTVTEGNQAVVDEPSLVNTDPEGEGWFFKLTLGDTHELNDLMNADQYKSLLRRACEEAAADGEHRLPLVAGRLCQERRLRAGARRRGAAVAGAAAGRADPRRRLRRRRADRADRRGGRAGDRPRQLAGDGRGGAGARASTPSSPTPRRWTCERFGQFDAVFSNAALHWMLDPDAVATGIFAALKAGGRFVGEMGGEGNLADPAPRPARRAHRARLPYAGAGSGLVCRASRSSPASIASPASATSAPS